ncbi:hypothetical protein ACFOHK_19580 [Falsigemmobacter intermedius]|uniref:Uncharacterized protein n=1 Tax=Falsigemmobacter intermedius TaxID=1553448 RepID=A0A3S3U9D8_9RHOB|nr:hypothetical protein [Falsigemmobacter intermedius]RWY37340.1 hypothetical protein EP867_17475 [Falsigemmobacter intermedius]
MSRKSTYPGCSDFRSHLSDQPPHAKPFIHLRRFLKFERDYKRSRLRLTAMELAVYLILGLVLLMAWTIYPIFARLY